MHLCCVFTRYKALTRKNHPMWRCRVPRDFTSSYAKISAQLKISAFFLRCQFTGVVVKAFHFGGCSLLPDFGKILHTVKSRDGRKASQRAATCERHTNSVCKRRSFALIATLDSLALASLPAASCYGHFFEVPRLKRVTVDQPRQAERHQCEAQRVGDGEGQSVSQHSPHSCSRYRIDAFGDYQRECGKWYIYRAVS